jgi:hypothetical protein
VYQSWEVDAAGRWRCESIGVSIGLEGAAVTVSTHAGVPLPHEGQIMATLARTEAELACKDAEREELRRQLEERRERND